MKKLLLASLVGGLILFVWGFLAWAVLPIHNAGFRSLPNDSAIIPILQSNITADGFYYFPGMTEETPGMTAEQRQAAMDAWTNKQMRGPIGMIIYHPNGMDPMMVGQFIWGFVIFFIAAFIASWLLSRSTAAAAPYLSRVVYCGMLGVFASFVSHISNMNWMYFPMDYTTGMVADTIIGWLLAGAGIAAIVKAPKSESA
jgi:hypothetical protein